MNCKICATKPELYRTGYKPPHPVMYCRCCKEVYWEHLIKNEKNNVIGIEVKNEPPFKWGSQSKEGYLLENDYWFLRRY